MKKIWTPQRITALKGQEKIVSLTAYDFATAKLLDEAGLHLLLVGDSVGTTLLGYPNTLPVTLDQIIHHTAAVVRGTQYALVAADMPFMTYQASIEQALLNSGRVLQETGCGAVKIEGGEFRAPTIQALVENGIPVLAHIGLTPQSVKILGHKVQGRGSEAAEQLLRDARAVEAAGAFAVVVETVPAALGKLITEALDIPVISIGAGPDCDGQIMVVNDMLGLGGDFKPKFVKRYADLDAIIKEAAESYKNDVQAGAYPAAEHCYE